MIRNVMRVTGCLPCSEHVVGWQRVEFKISRVRGVATALKFLPV